MRPLPNVPTHRRPDAAGRIAATSSPRIVVRVKRLVAASDPDPPLAILRDLEDRVRGDRPRVRRVVPEDLEASRPTVEPREAAVRGGDPQAAFAIEAKRQHVASTGLHALEPARIRVEPVQPVLRPDPKRSIRRLGDDGDAVVPEGCGILRIVPEMLERPGRAIEELQSAGVGSDPKTSLGILDDGADDVIGDRGRVARVVLELAKGVAVVEVQPASRPDPQEPRPVLAERGDHFRQRPVLGAHALEVEVGRGDREREEEEGRN
jgi:hypothetical protein